MTVTDKRGLSKVKPLKKLTIKLPKSSGRNSAGRITVRHQGGGHRKLYRLVDFKQIKTNIPARVEEIEYDPYRTSHIARVVYQTGERSYVLALQGLRPGDKIVAGDSVELNNGNRLKLANIPVGYQVSNVELEPGRGGQLARSAGTYVEVAAHEGKYVHLKMPSGEVRKVVAECRGTLGKISNAEHNLQVIGKAGRQRWLGVRPTVRGSAMNPVDHPYGGGEGRTQRGTRRTKDIWGNITGGRRTRSKKKPSGKMIIQRRKKK